MGTAESADKGNVRGTAWRRMIGSALVLALCTLALYALHRQLRTYHLQDIRRALASIPSVGLWCAGLFTVLGYAAMTGYDALALRYVGRPLAFSKMALASFMSYAFSNNMGFGMLAGGSVRYRLYSGNFQGLRHYKEKFDPEWSPRYLASPGGLTLPQVLGDLSSLISGGIGGLVGK